MGNIQPTFQLAKTHCITSFNVCVQKSWKGLCSVTLLRKIWWRVICPVIIISSSKQICLLSHWANFLRGVNSSSDPLKHELTVCIVTYKFVTTYDRAIRRIHTGLKPSPGLQNFVTLFLTKSVSTCNLGMGHAMKIWSLPCVSTTVSTVLH